MPEVTSETGAIELAEKQGPATVDSLSDNLRNLGVKPGETLLVHTSLSRLGWVCGGPIAVIDALRHTLGEDGTIVMPTHTAVLTDPAGWSNPPVPETWWQTLRDQTPAFDKARTPSNRMGVVAETFRTQPGVLRSDHPVGSFAAQGPRAAEIVAHHPLEDIFGDGSPLGRLYDSGASILLLGVGHENSTALHLAECRAGVGRRPQGSPIQPGGKRTWATYEERLHDSDHFPAIADAYAASGGSVRAGKAGSGEAILTLLREIVDFATVWMVDRPQPPV